MLHDADVVVHYEVMNLLHIYTCQVWVFRQIGIAHVIQTNEQLDSVRARRVVFS